MLRVATEGGFTPVDYQLTNMPTFSLYGDGTIVTTGPMIEIYPPPALPSLQSQTVDSAGMDAIVAAAIDAGLDSAGDLTDMGSVAIADAPDTVFTLHADGVDTTVRVYALMALQERPPTMSKEEWEARVALNGLVEDLMDLPSWFPTVRCRASPSPTRPPALVSTWPTTKGNRTWPNHRSHGRWNHPSPRSAPTMRRAGIAAERSRARTGPRRSNPSPKAPTSSPRGPVTDDDGACGSDRSFPTNEAVDGRPFAA